MEQNTNKQNKTGKIAIAAAGQKMSDPVDMRFGRCPFFAVIDIATDKTEFIPNEAGRSFQGAGITAAQLIANQKVQAVIAGNYGPKAMMVLQTADIKLYQIDQLCPISEALKLYKQNKLKQLSSSTSPNRSWGGRRA